MSILFVNRKGSRLGHDTIVDGMMKDGLWDVYNDFGMGVCAEICADQHKITREEQVILAEIHVVLGSPMSSYFLIYSYWFWNVSNNQHQIIRKC